MCHIPTSQVISLRWAQGNGSVGKVLVHKYEDQILICRIHLSLEAVVSICIRHSYRRQETPQSWHYSEQSTLCKIRWKARPDTWGGPLTSTWTLHTLSRKKERKNKRKRKLSPCRFEKTKPKGTYMGDGFPTSQKLHRALEVSVASDPAGRKPYKRRRPGLKPDAQEG